METEIKFNIQDEASRWTRQFCSQLFDLSRAGANPDALLKDYLAVFARQVAKELHILDVDGQALDIFKKNL